MSAKIITASYDQSLKQEIIRNISGTNVDIISAFNIVEATSKFSQGEPNVLIYDIDRGVMPSKYISILLNKYNLLIILTGSDPKRAYDFYAFGVKDYIIKPENFATSDGKEFMVSIRERIKMFFNQNRVSQNINSSHTRFSQNFNNNRNSNSSLNAQRQYMFNSKLGYKKDVVIAIASSTGGTEALDFILRNLPSELPPILIVQHMPSTFTAQFAQRLNNYSKLEIKEAYLSEPIYPGTVYIAPGNLHMVLTKTGNQLSVKCIDGKKINGVRPAADVLFKSVAEIMGNKAIGIILTGMGADGARGLSIMHNVGSVNIGQDKESCVVYGMPKVAYDLGCIDFQLPLSQIPKKIVELADEF